MGLKKNGDVKGDDGLVTARRSKGRTIKQHMLIVLLYIIKIVIRQNLMIELRDRSGLFKYNSQDKKKLP